MKKLVYFLIVGLAFTAPQVAHSDPMKELPPGLQERDGSTHQILNNLISGDFIPKPPTLTDDDCTQWVMDKGVRMCADPNLAQKSPRPRARATTEGAAKGEDRTPRPNTGATRVAPFGWGMR